MISPSTILTTTAAKLASGTFISDGFATIRNIFSSSEQAPATNHSPVSTRENVSNVRSSAEDIFSDSRSWLFNDSSTVRQLRKIFPQKKAAKKELTNYRLTENLLEVLPLLTEFLQENNSNVDDEFCALTVKASLEQLTSSLPINLHLFKKQFFTKVFDLKFQLEINSEYEVDAELFINIENLYKTCQEYLSGHQAGQENLETVFDLVAVKKEFIKVHDALLELKQTADDDNEFPAFIAYMENLLQPFSSILTSLEITTAELLKKINVHSKPYADRIITLLSDWQTYAGYHQSPSKKGQALLNNLHHKAQALIDSGFLSVTEENLDPQSALQLIEFYDYLTKVAPLLSDVTEGHIGMFMPELNSAITEFRERCWGDYNYIVQLHLGASASQLDEQHENLIYLQQKYPNVINDKIKVSFPKTLEELFKKRNWQLTEEIPLTAAAATKIEIPLCMENLAAALSSYSDNVAVNIHAVLDNLSQSLKLIENQSVVISRQHHLQLVNIISALDSCYLLQERSCTFSDINDIALLLTTLNELEKLSGEIKAQTANLPEQWIFLAEDLSKINNHLRLVINTNVTEALPSEFDATEIAATLQRSMLSVLSRDEYIVLASQNSAWINFLQATNTLVEEQNRPDVKERFLSWRHYLERFAVFMEQCAAERESSSHLMDPLEQLLLRQLQPITLFLQQPILQQVKATQKQLTALAEQLQTLSLRHANLANRVLEDCGDGAAVLRQLMTGRSSAVTTIHKLESDLFTAKESADQFALLAQHYQKEIAFIQQGKFSQVVEYIYSNNDSSALAISCDLGRLLEIEKELSDADLKNLPLNVRQLREQFSQLTKSWPEKIKNALIMKMKSVQFSSIELFNGAQLLKERLQFIVDQANDDKNCDIFSLPFAKRYILNAMHISASHEIELPNDLLLLLDELLLLTVKKYGHYFVEQSDILISPTATVFPSKNNAAGHAAAAGGVEQLPQWLIKLFSLPAEDEALLPSAAQAKHDIKFTKRQQQLSHLHPLQSAAHIEQVIAGSKPQPSAGFDLEQVIAYHLAAAAGDFVEDKQRLLAMAAGAGVLMFANQSVSQMSRRFARVTPQQALVAKAKTAASKIKFAVSQTPLRHLSPVPVWQFVNQHLHIAKDALFSVLYFNSLVQDALDEAALDELLIHDPNFISKVDPDMLAKMPSGVLELLISLTNEKLEPFSSQYQFDDLFIYDDTIGIVKKESLSAEEGKLADIYMLRYLARKLLETRNS
ncbi:MAG: hypothetical protein ACRC24_07975 [Vibrionaceae bacterium]